MRSPGLPWAFALLLVNGLPHLLYAQDEISRLSRQGSSELASGDLDSASRDFDAALAKAQASGKPGPIFLCQENLSRLSERRNDLAKAEQWLQSAVLTARESRKLSLMTALADREAFYRRHGMREQSINTLTELSQVWSATAGPNSIGAARFQFELGEQLSASGDYPAAETRLGEAAAKFQASGSLYDAAARQAQKALVTVLMAEGKVDEAQQMKAASPQAIPATPMPKPDIMPRVLAKSDPQYSDGARKLKVAGYIRLSADVDATGHPQNVQVLLPLGEGLDEKAVKAVSSWVFEPATKGGVPVTAHAIIEVNFRLY